MARPRAASPTVLPFVQEPLDPALMFDPVPRWEVGYGNAGAHEHWVDHPADEVTDEAPPPARTQAQAPGASAQASRTFWRTIRTWLTT